MTRLIKTCCISFAFFINAYGADLELKLNSGGTFKSHLGKFKTARGGKQGPITIHGENTTATIDKNPKLGSTFGIDANLFFNQTVGVNLGIQHSKYEVPDSTITLVDPSAPTHVTSFPNFTTKITSIQGGVILKKNSLLSPYVGLNLVLGLGSLDNTKFSISPSKYGIGGNKTGLLMLGAMFKTGINYYFNEKVSLGLEYRYQYLTIQDTNQQFRSFNKGFKGSIASNSLLLQVGYKFKV